MNAVLSRLCWRWTRQNTFLSHLHGWGWATILKAFALVLCCLGFALDCQADGPHIAYHGTAGPYTVTLFSAPDPLVAGPATLTLLVQSAADDSVVSPSGISGELQLAGHPPVSFPMDVAPGAANRALPSATVSLPDAGTYALTLQVAGAQKQQASFRGLLPVEENHGQRNTVLAAVFLPMIVVGLFLANQTAKQQLRRRLPPSATP